MDVVTNFLYIYRSQSPRKKKTIIQSVGERSLRKNSEIRRKIKKSLKFKSELKKFKVFFKFKQVQDKVSQNRSLIKMKVSNFKSKSQISQTINKSNF